MADQDIDKMFAEHKTCSVCGEYKHFSEFNKSKGKPRSECRECSRVLRKRRYDANPEPEKARAAAARAKNPELAKARTDAWRSANPERVKEYMDNWHESNRDRRRLQYNENKEAILAQSRAYNEAHREETLARYQANREESIAKSVAWAQANPERANATRAKHRAARRNQTPPWLNKAHFVEIEGYYQFCRIFNQSKLHVDHVVPLQNDNVAGLHAPWNLQILTQSENNSKKNKIPDMSTIAPYIERPTLVIDENGFASLEFDDGIVHP